MIDASGQVKEAGYYLRSFIYILAKNYPFSSMNIIIIINGAIAGVSVVKGQIGQIGRYFKSILLSPVANPRQLIVSEKVEMHIS